MDGSLESPGISAASADSKPPWLVIFSSFALALALSGALNSERFPQAVIYLKYMPLVLIVGIYFRYLKDAVSRVRVFSPLFLTAVFFVILLAGSTVNRIESGNWVDLLIFTLSLLVFLVVQQVHGGLGLLKTLWGATFISTVASLVLILLFPSIGVSEGYRSGIEEARARGTLYHPVMLGELAVMAIGLGWMCRRDIGKLTGYILTLSGMVLLVMSVTRTAYVALMIAMAYVLWRAAVSRNKKRLILIGSGFVFLISTTLIVDSVFSLPFGEIDLGMFSRRGDAAEVATFNGRLEFWPPLVEIGLHRPLFGHGFASSEEVIKLNGVSTRNGFYVPPNAHNVVIHVLLEYGFIALVVLIASAIQTYRSLDHGIAPKIAAFALAALATYGLLSVTPFGSSLHPMTLMFYFLILRSDDNFVKLDGASTGRDAEEPERARPQG